MLQQTRVSSVLEYFPRFITEFPTPAALATAPEQRLLELWAGLGYYQRARHLKHGAEAVVERFGGVIPQTLEELRSLPGVGAYTSAAIASIAFDLPVGVVDGNVMRVLARLMAIDAPVSPNLSKLLQKFQDELVQNGHAGDTNQAIMDLGAVICTPKSPTCAFCPWNASCAAHKQGLEEELPRPKERPERPRIEVVAGLVQTEREIWLSQRPAKGLLAGLWELPSVEGTNDPNALKMLGLTPSVQVAEITHAFTHREWHVRVFKAVGEPQNGPYQKHQKWQINAENQLNFALQNATERLLEHCPLGGPALKALRAAGLPLAHRRGAGKISFRPIVNA